ncbi:hypothetical protein GCK72_007813 [Caenorhabditis remanei]|uniref:Uncharacterized protein n=1 Tax=Caenorhabditis remanei TaxID=31234 RepID=A0A6A5HMM8_CAERE|nr:hypothetical protein GCK72_007813 [Caenorhabditis remanei]KAF1767854.1 hypothetical protein GCK72_007813 [Caenorhabditis remanei]
MDTVVLIINVVAICIYVALKGIQFRIHKKYALREPLRSLVIRNAVHNGVQFTLGLLLRPQIYFSVFHFSITSSPNTWIPMPPQLLHLLLCTYFAIIAIRPVTNLVNYLKHKKHHDAKFLWTLIEISLMTGILLTQAGIAYADWDYEESGVISVAKIKVAEGIQIFLTVVAMIVHLSISLLDSPIDSTYRQNIQPSEVATLNAYFNALKWQNYITTLSVCVSLGIPGVLHAFNLDGNNYTENLKSLMTFSVVLAPLFEEIVVMWIGRKDSRSNIAKVTIIGEREEGENGWFKKVIGFIITTMMARRHVYIHRG